MQIRRMYFLFLFLLSFLAYTGLSQAADTVWVEDSPPSGSIRGGTGEGWVWVSANPSPHSGSLAHQSAVLGGMHQHFFYNTPTANRLSINAGDTLFTYVYLDPTNPPSEIMLAWNSGAGQHRAYWGANSINLGVDGTASRRYMGALPPVGQWVRLEVPANQVGLEGSSLHGMAFALYNGRATWDRAGKSSSPSGSNIPPLVNLSAPTNNASYTAPATITLNANATDSDGSISQVEFYHGGTLINTDTSAPYSYTWSNVPVGSYNLTARAIDNTGAVTASTPITVTVRAVAGTDLVWVEDSPPSGSIRGGTGEGWVWVSANPSPHSGSLAHQSAVLGGMHQHFFYNTPTANRLSINAGDTLFTYVYLDPTNPPSEIMLAWNSGAGQHRAYWGANSINLGVDGTASRRYMGALPPVGQWVRLEVPANQVGLEGSSLHGMAFALYNGRATWDRAGKSSSPSGSNIPPLVNLNAPTNNASYTAPATITLNANATDSDGSISQVEFYNGGTLINTDTSAPYSYTWSNVPVGSYNLTARATDNTGASTTSTVVNVSVIASAPSVSISANPTTISSGGSSTLTWSSSNATSCTASGGWSGSKATSGNQLTGALTATSSFVLTCTGVGGSASQTAGVTVTAVGGSSTLSGTVDSSLIANLKQNAIYVYAGNVTPDDLGGTGAQAFKVVPVSQNNGACGWGYNAGSLADGQYTLAFTNQAATDNPLTDDALAFQRVTVLNVSGGAVSYQFSPTRVLTVGLGKTYPNVMAAAAAVQNGDVIEIDAAQYDDNIVVWRANDLTLRGVGGRAHMHATKVIPYSGSDLENGKGLWVTRGANIKVENIEFSNATVPDKNGAGIRAEGANLSVCNSYFHENENGILGGAGEVLIEYSEFANNGGCAAGFGCAHNLYIINTDKLVFRHNYSHHAKIGHLLKSRAKENHILYNRLTGESGTASYEVDIPDGGLTYLVGNLIQQGVLTDNPTMVAYAAESASNPIQQLYAVNNTLVNERGSGTAISIRTGTIAQVINNLFVGSGTTVSGTATQTGNLTTNVPNFVNQATYDYHLTSASPGINGGSNPGASSAGFALVPIFQYLHPSNREARTVNGALDIGAYEFVGIQPPAAPLPTVTFGASPASVNSGGSSTLIWSSTNATSCTASGAWSGSKAMGGNQSTGALSTSSSYTLTCTGAGGSASQSAAVSVTPGTPAPIVTLNANPASVASGGSSTLTWSSTNATSCTASGAWSGSKAISGNQSTGVLSTSSSFTLTCAGAGGSASQSVSINVATPPALYALNVIVSGSGTVTSNPSGIACGATCSASYPSGAVVTLSAVAAAGYTFSGWSGACTGTGTCTANMTANVNVTATFALVGGTLTVNASHASGSYAAAQYVSLISSKPNTTIYYTTDNSTPTLSSKIYTNPVVIGANINSFILQFFGRDVAGNSSGVTTRTYTTGTTLTDLQVVNTSSSIQANVPITFGQVFKEGEVAPGTSVAGTLSSAGSPITLQVNVKATHADGSVRHAIISAVLPSLNAGATETISFTKAAMDLTTAVTPATFLKNNPTFSARVDVTVGGVAYSADAVALLGGTYTQWLSGPIANEWIVSGPLRKVSDNAAHPHLEARFAIRSFAGSSKTKVDITVENNKTFTAGSQNFTYDYSIYVGGAPVDAFIGLEHFHHARWHKSFWWGTAPQVHLKHNIDYLIATKAVPNYDRSVTPSPAAITNMVTGMVGNTGPMKVGLVLPYMPTTGGRIDIGPLPGWYALYLLSMDKGAKDVMMGIADGSGSWSMHYRDETDANNMPVRVDKTGTSANGANYRDISTHGNVASSGPLPVPRCVGDSPTLCVTPFTHDAAHQPGLAYLPYLVTGDFFYLEELQFWVASNPLETGSSYRGYEKGLINWDQVRAQAWSMRTLGQAAYITPDTHPAKTLYNTMVAENLAYYNGLYTTNAGANQLGILNIHILYPTVKGPETGYAPWQDDFFTWSIGYLAELGFTDAQPLLVWKSKFSVGRMTGPSYCWIMGAEYALAVRPSSSSPIYTTFADVYQAAYSAVGIDGTKLTDKACGSQAMTDWVKANTGYIYLSQGEMTGYSTSDAGFPSNMQIGLSVAASSGIPNAQAAWITFMNRTNKPDYSSGPQFAVVPRN